MDKYETMFVCSQGSPSEFEQKKFSGNECMCEKSCEPHIHEKGETILCLHDGENDHSHCPNAKQPTHREI